MRDVVVSDVNDVLYDLQLEIPGYEELIAKTILRLPSPVQDKVRREVRFISMLHHGETLSPRKCESKPWIIVLNFGLMKREHRPDEKKADLIAHEIAHFILGHEHASPEDEKSADSLSHKWGFRKICRK